MRSFLLSAEGWSNPRFFWWLCSVCITSCLCSCLLKWTTQCLRSGRLQSWRSRPRRWERPSVWELEKKRTKNETHTLLTSVRALWWLCSTASSMERWEAVSQSELGLWSSPERIKPFIYFQVQHELRRRWRRWMLSRHLSSRPRPPHSFVSHGSRHTQVSLLPCSLGSTTTSALPGDTDEVWIKMGLKSAWSPSLCVPVLGYTLNLLPFVINAVHIRYY